MNMLATVLLVAGACSTDDDRPITQDEYDDVAQSVASSTATSGGGDVIAMADAVLLATGNLPLGFQVSSEGHFAGSHLGLDYRFFLTCHDHEGNLLAVCNPTTEHADLDLAWSGTVAMQRFAATVSRTGAWSMAALRSETVVLAGIASFTYESTVTRESTTTAYHFVDDATYTHILIDKTSGMAVGGTIDHAIDATKLDPSGVSFEVDARITFNGNATATIVLDNQYTYTLNLVTGALAR